MWELYALNTPALIYMDVDIDKFPIESLGNFIIPNCRPDMEMCQQIFKYDLKITGNRFKPINCICI